jgi:hypothetical protein
MENEIIGITGHHPTLGVIEIDVKEGNIPVGTLSEVTFTTIDGKEEKRFMDDIDLIKMLHNQVVGYSKEYRKVVDNNDVLKTMIRDIVKYSETTGGLPPNWQKDCLDKIENL